MNSWDAFPWIYRMAAGIISAAGTLAAVMGFAFRTDEALDGQIWPLLLVILGIAVALFGLGVIALSFRSTGRIDRLVDGGDFVYADIIRLDEEPHTRVNGYPVYRIICCYTDPLTGTVHTFRSRVFYLGEKEITKDKVKVYVDRDSGYKNYLVSVEDVLPPPKSQV